MSIAKIFIWQVKQFPADITADEFDMSIQAACEISLHSKATDAGMNGTDATAVMLRAINASRLEGMRHYFSVRNRLPQRAIV